MDAVAMPFGVMGFIFGLMAFTQVAAASKKIAKLGGPGRLGGLGRRSTFDRAWQQQHVSEESSGRMSGTFEFSP